MSDLPSAESALTYFGSKPFDGHGYDAIDDDGKIPTCFGHSLEDVIQTHVLQFCGCGLPDANLGYIYRALSAIHDKDWDEIYAVLPEYGPRYFLFYWLDKEEFTEHGGSVPGWLTDKGLNLLALLAEWRAISPITY